MVTLDESSPCTQAFQRHGTTKSQTVNSAAEANLAENGEDRTVTSLLSQRQEIRTLSLRKLFTEIQGHPIP